MCDDVPVYVVIRKEPILPPHSLTGGLFLSLGACRAGGWTTAACQEQRRGSDGFVPEAICQDPVPLLA